MRTTYFFKENWKGLEAFDEKSLEWQLLQIVQFFIMYWIRYCIITMLCCMNPCKLFLPEVSTYVLNLEFLFKAPFRTVNRSIATRVKLINWQRSTFCNKYSFISCKVNRYVSILILRKKKFWLFFANGSYIDRSLEIRLRHLCVENPSAS